MANSRQAGPLDSAAGIRNIPAPPAAALGLIDQAAPGTPSAAGVSDSAGARPPGRSAQPPQGAVRRAPPSTLSLSAAGSDLLKQVETLRLIPYDDQTGKDIKNWLIGATIGYGHLISNADWHSYKDGITKVVADDLFDRDAAPFIAQVRAAMTAQLAQNEFDALVILAFNIGCWDFAGSSVVKLINNPAAKTSYASLEQAWKAWNKSQGKAMKGLDNRRQCEWNIYTLAIYKGW